jgi:hypothetical protein
MATDEAFIARLPLVHDNSPVTAVLENPQNAVFGVVVSTDGSEYRLHRLEDLSAARAEFGGSAPLARLRARAKPLRTFTEAEAKQAGIALTVPSSQTWESARRAFQDGLGVVPGLESSVNGAVAWVFTHQANNYVVAGSAYRCSQYSEPYNESQYVAYNGICPLHEGALIVKA